MEVLSLLDRFQYPDFVQVVCQKFSSSSDHSKVAMLFFVRPKKVICEMTNGISSEKAAKQIRHPEIGR
jgi:hypothetical protein